MLTSFNLSWSLIVIRDRLEFTSSRTFNLLLVATHLLGIGCVYLSQLPVFAYFFLLLFIAVHFAWHMYQYVDRRSALSVLAIEWYTNQSAELVWRVTTRLGVHDAQLLNEVFVSTFLIVARFRLNKLGTNKLATVSAIIFADSCDGNIFRRLRVLLLNYRNLQAANSAKILED